MNYAKKSALKAQEQVDYLMKLISEYHYDVQERVSELLPAGVHLNKTNVKTIEELALLPYAKEQGLPYKAFGFDLSKIIPPCPYCGEKSRITKNKGKNTYLCNRCNKKYTPHKDSIISNTKVSTIVWMQTLLCLLGGYTIERTCKYCRYSRETYYNIRNKLFYAMQLFMDEVKLYGEVQCDNTEVHISFKGLDLSDNDYPEDSPFYIEDFVPRPARARGGPYKHSELSMNKIPIFTAIDSYGHVLARQAGIGATTHRTIEEAVGENKILLKVPRKDPFNYPKPIKVKNNKYKKNKEKDIGNQELTETLLVSDGELSIKKYAEKVGLKHEAHVYRKDNKQLKLSKDAHNIQKVNNVHKKLKEFLRSINGSTKYLPGFLSLFEFKMNTGATEEAIEHLFEILVTPGLGKSPEFYRDLFTVPNYIVEWSKKDSPLKKFDYNQLYCVYLYHKKKSDEPGFQLTVKEITEETGYSKSQMRRLYKNFKSSGLLNDIIEHFDAEKPRKKKETPPELIAILREYAVNRSLPYKQRKTIEEFVEYAKQKYKTSYSKSVLLYYAGQSQEFGIEIENKSLKTKKINGQTYSEKQIETGYMFYHRYDEIYKEFRAKNLKPKKEVIFTQVAEEEGYSIAYVKGLYYHVRNLELK